MNREADQRMGVIAAAVFLLDQLTKLIVRRVLFGADEWVVIDGFFKLVHWRNTGAAWSFFQNQNGKLAIISICALVALIYLRRHFEHSTLLGQVALGLIAGGIIGNLSDRLLMGHVVDFLRFYLYQRSGNEIGFPAFNVADSSIFVGVGLLVLRSIQQPAMPEPASSSK